MHYSILIGLLQNIAILLAFSMLYGNFWIKREAGVRIPGKIITGLILGGIGILIMHSPWTMVPGIIFDTRSILLSVSGLFFGTIPTIVAMLITGITRFLRAGDGMYMGMAVILCSGIIGLFWRQYRSRFGIKKYYLELLGLGILVHAAMLACTALLPADQRFQTFRMIVLPLVFIYAPGTMLLGLLMERQRQNYLNRDAKEKLLETERRLNEVLRSGNIVSVILGVNGNVRFCNSYFLSITGYSEEEVLGKNAFDLIIPQEQLAEIKAAYSNIMKTGKFDKISENEIVTKNGNLLYISWHNTLFSNTSGHHTGMASIGVDLTGYKAYERSLNEKKEEIEAQNEEYRQLNEELLIAKDKAEESDRLKSAFLANLSHEIRTPMNAILGFSELLKDPDMDSGRRQNFIDIILKSGNHLLSLINDIVELSKIEAGQITINYEKIMLQQFCEDIYQTMSIASSQHPDIEFKMILPESTRSDYLVADSLRLRQVLNNLINNAFKFTQKGKISFGYRWKPDREISFFVEDTGVGIDPKYHSMIFERFTQVESDLTIQKGGTGLGLSISRAFVELMQGKIYLTSEPDKGSVFHVDLPSGNEASAGQKAEPALKKQ